MNSNQLFSYFHKKTVFWAVLIIFMLFSCQTNEKIDIPLQALSKLKTDMINKK